MHEAHLFPSRPHKVSWKNPKKVLAIPQNYGIIDLMKATNKDPQIDALLSTMMGGSRQLCVENAECISCNGEARIFRDDVSRKEFTISALCQNCQDDIFGAEEEVEPWK